VRWGATLTGSEGEPDGVGDVEPLGMADGELLATTGDADGVAVGCGVVCVVGAGAGGGGEGTR